MKCERLVHVDGRTGKMRSGWMELRTLKRIVLVKILADSEKWSLSVEAAF